MKKSFTKKITKNLPKIIKRPVSPKKKFLPKKSQILEKKENLPKLHGI